MKKLNINKLKTEQNEHLTDEAKADLTLSHEKKLLKVNNDVSVTKKKYTKLLHEHEELNKQFDFIQSLDLASVKSVPIEPKHSSKTSEATAIMVGGDWHAFEIVDPKTVNNSNEYNPIIAQKSIRNFFKNGLRLVEINRHGVKINNLIVTLLGDLMNGYIHDDFKEMSGGTPQEEMRFIFKEVCDGLDFLLKYGKFNKIIVTGNCGNHGRATKFTNISNMAANSNETLLYHMIADRYSNNKKIEFVIADGYHIYQEVYGYKLRMHHGDSLKGGLGVGGISVPVKRAIARWNTEYKADLDILGHFHQFYYGGDFFMTGSMVGANGFSKFIKAPFEEPKQGFLLIDKKRFVTVVSPIFVR
jgi:hypothetical protein